jgi:hypothetical protein
MTEAKSPRRPSPDPWDKEAKRLVKSAMTLHGYTFKSLAAVLEKSGYGSNTAEALTLRVNRASFNMGFALRLLRVMGVKSLDLSHIKMHKPPPNPGPHS